jgi:cyclohexa-1,5-dienecarbonyl-CoA hydratase
MISVSSDAGGALLRVGFGWSKGNILDLATIRAMRAALRERIGAAGLRAILLEGTGAHFSYGASVEEHRPAQAAQMLRELHGLLLDLWESCVPVVAVVRGVCLGGGLELALACTRVVAAPDARFGAPEIKLGVFAPFASVMLPIRVGLAAAERLLVSGEPIDAAHARAAGIVDEIAEDPAAAAEQWARRTLLPNSGASLRFALRAARTPFRERVESALREAERQYLEDLMATHDAREGIAAFLEKRPPQWEDR